MAMRKRKMALMQAMSELKETDYTRAPEISRIYNRLLRGRQQFAEVFEKNIKAVMQISSLDLTMQYQTEKILDISRKVTKATETIFGSAVGSGHTNNQHEEMTNTIIEVSGEAEEVFRKIDAGQTELTTIKELSAETISISREMKQDMDELINIINQMNAVIAGIDSISLQTNILALNASVEASRAGDAGKGFSVVANEIRSLAEETQKLTRDMSTFVDNMKNASQKSVHSSTSTIQSLDSMSDRINNIWVLNDESKQHVSKVTESISAIAAVSEEISSSMSEMENQLRDSTDFMRQVGQELQQAALPVVDIEKTLDETVKQMGNMTQDDFFQLKNTEFAEYMKNAISSHRAWLGNLRKMINERKISPLQLDSAKCGFGHFYYAMTPRIPGVAPIWEGLGPKHRKFHTYGADVINAINNKSYMEAERLYYEAENYSRDLIADMEKILQLTNE